MTTPDATLSMLEAVSARLEIMTQNLDRTADLIEANSGQVAAMTEGLTRLENLVERGFERIKQNFSNLETLMRQQHETTRIQANHIDRLTGIVETLI
jgi:archaellum component FlaC